MPTVEELASLIRGNVGRGLHINPLRTTKRKLCWSSDSGYVEDRYMKDVWIVSFVEGKVVLQMLDDNARSIFSYEDTYYVRGVRSAR